MEKVINLYSKFKSDLVNEKISRQAIYEISSVLDSYKDTGEVYLTIHVKGTSNTFQKSVKDLYQKEWLNEFSKEDVAYIGFLYAAEVGDNLPIVEHFPRKKQKVTKSVLVLAMLFVTFLILSNLTAFKVAELKLSHLLWVNLGSGLTIDFPAALILFPLTYFFDDTLTEVYGFRISRLIIWGGLLANTIFILASWATVYLPPSPLWDTNTNHGQQAYSLILTGSWRIFVGSALGYFCGEFLNSIILAKLKILTSGKLLFLRVIGSTIVGVGIDSLIFCNIAFWNILPYKVICGIIAAQYIFKITYEIIMLPVTYLLTALLKKMDQVDYYDFKTKFNPFSLSLNE